MNLLSPGTSVIQVTAIDADDPTYGNSARVVYSILEGQPYFSVDPETGQCQVKKSNPKSTLNVLDIQLLVVYFVCMPPCCCYNQLFLLMVVCSLKKESFTTGIFNRGSGTPRGSLESLQGGLQIIIIIFNMIPTYY